LNLINFKNCFFIIYRVSHLNEVALEIRESLTANLLKGAKPLDFEEFADYFYSDTSEGREIYAPDSEEGYYFRKTISLNKIPKFH
jgi:hypothetical protein